MDEIEVIAKVDLAQYITLGPQWLYSTLQSLHRPVYAPNQRIDFYLNSPHPLSREIEDTLNKFLVELDIPTYFVRTRFPEHIDEISDTRCAYPWLHFYASPQGNIQPCCLANGDFGNVSQYNTLEDIANAPAMKQLRLDMLAGKWNKACIACKQAEKAIGTSYRTKANDHWQTDYATKEDGSIDFKMRFYDVRLSNLCNFRCRTCTGELSSSIAIENGESLPLFKSRFSKAYENLFTDVIKNIGSIEEFNFAGGEPLLMEEHYRILDALIQHNRTDVHLTYNTNFSTLTYKRKHVTDWWNKFSNVSVGMSLDAMGSAAEILRKGTNWQGILSNIAYVREHSPHVNLRITSTASIFNVFNVTKLHSYAIETLGFSPDNIIIMIAYGDTNDLRVLPLEVKRRATKHLRDFIATLPPCKLADQYNDVIVYMNSENRDYLWNKAKHNAEDVDLRRGESIFDSQPGLLL